MLSHFLFTGLSIIFTVLILPWIARSQVLGPSVAEVKYSYRMQFQIPKDASETTNLERAQMHASHMFGILSSPKLIANYISPHSSVGGLGAPRMESTIQIHSIKYKNDLVVIDYTNSGKMLLHKKAAEKMLKDGELVLALPKNPYDIYDPRCTDEHYNGFGDYWYFYDPYKEGCEYLSLAPMAEQIPIKITKADYKNLATSPDLPKLRGNNGNGELLSIFVINGYDESADRHDSGSKNFRELKKSFERRGFEVTSKRVHTAIPLNIYTKELVLNSGKKIQVEVKHLLANTDIMSKNVSFARFFKEAVETADVIIYGGHSGLGANLDIPSLEEKAGKFVFNHSKKQLFFFDSCSSYSYFLDHFSYEKTKSKIDILSYGLASYFEMAQPILDRLFNYLLSKEDKDFSWMQIMKSMEEPLGEESYLLNVGGL